MKQGLEINSKRRSELFDERTKELLLELHRRFDARRKELLAARAKKTSYDFLAATKSVRDTEWTIAPVPEVLLDRRVEITGPPDPKMVINALNSGASVFMADFEDSLAPTWDNLVTGQEALKLAVRRTLQHTSAEGKSYRLNDKSAVLFARPRGWHLDEAHVSVDGKAMSGSLFDFGVYFLHNAAELLKRGAGPFFYLPKMESHLEARLWNDVFCFAQGFAGIPQGSVKATVLIETLPAAFEMHEILYELREHSAGLNCGRWDYMFSFIKKQPDVLLPDRGQLTMDKGFLRAYSQLLIRTCHRRGAHAMGGMAAQIPIKGDDAANDAAMEKVRADKRREVTDGHDGTWVAHPGLVQMAKQIFDELMPGKNQLTQLREDVNVGRAELLAVPEGTRTEDGLKHNVRVGVRYLEAWLRGLGCVPLYNLMEDAATAEISRAQVWQQLHAGAIKVEQLDAAMASELGTETGGRFAEAKALFRKLSTAPKLDDFLTVPAYQQLNELIPS
ncbi:MAG: malate synthase A [Myxococcaceae bacterium]